VNGSNNNCGGISCIIIFFSIIPMRSSMALPTAFDDLEVVVFARFLAPTGYHVRYKEQYIQPHTRILCFLGIFLIPF